MNEYHRYIIQGDRFIGRFEDMYKECTDPWNASTEDYDASVCSVATKRLVQSLWPASVVSLGCGTGRHLNWLDCHGDGVEISDTAAERARFAYPWMFVATDNILHFLLHDMIDYEIYLFREVVWYILTDWSYICRILSTRHGAWVMVELSFYDEQEYGRDYFDGPDQFVAKWPFQIEKIVREHSTKAQREGRLMIAGKVL
jgi:hypothetical protein